MKIRFNPVRHNYIILISLARVPTTCTGYHTTMSVSIDQFVNTFERTMNAVAFKKRKGPRGFTPADVLHALQDTMLPIGTPPAHLICGGETIDIASDADAQLYGQDFSMSITLDGTHVNVFVHDEMHTYCTNRSVLEVRMATSSTGCPYATSGLDMRIVEDLRKNGIRVRVQ